jgi:hypothetical protein
MTGLEKGDCFIEVATWTGLAVLLIHINHIETLPMSTYIHIFFYFLTTIPTFYFIPHFIPDILIMVFTFKRYLISYLWSLTCVQGHV